MSEAEHDELAHLRRKLAEALAENHELKLQGLAENEALRIRVAQLEDELMKLKQGTH